MTARYAIIVGLGIFALAGCHSAVQQEVDGLVCNRSTVPMDVPPLGFLVTSPKEPPPRPPIDPRQTKEQFIKRMEVPGTYANLTWGRRTRKRSVPGSEAAKIKLPANFERSLRARKSKRPWTSIFKSQMDVGPDPQPVTGPDGRPLSLADLQKMAREHSPLLRQAASDIANADGQRIQAAVYYNPTFRLRVHAGLLHQRQHRGPRHQPDDCHHGQAHAGGSGGQDGPGKRQTGLPPCRNRLDGRGARPTTSRCWWPRKG